MVSFVEIVGTLCSGSGALTTLLAQRLRLSMLLMWADERHEELGEAAGSGQHGGTSLPLYRLIARTCFGVLWRGSEYVGCELCSLLQLEPSDVEMACSGAIGVPLPSLPRLPSTLTWSSVQITAP